MKNLTFEQKESLCYFSHPKHLDTLVSDKNSNVRCQVAKYGNDKHRDILVHDKNPAVRCDVAWKANEDQARKLFNYKNEWVKDTAKRRLKTLGIKP